MAVLLEIDTWTPGNVLTAIFILLLLLAMLGVFDRE